MNKITLIKIKKLNRETMINFFGTSSGINHKSFPTQFSSNQNKNNSIIQFFVRQFF